MFFGTGKKRSADATSSAWIVSVLSHVALLVLLAFILLPEVVHQSLLRLHAAHSEPAEVPELITELSVSAQPLASAPTFDTPVEVPMLLRTSEVDSLASVMREQSSIPGRLEAISHLELLSDSETRSESLEPPRRGRDVPWEIRKPVTTEAISAASDVIAAFDPIEKAIRAEVDQGDTLVVWLMDASISLQLNRSLLARRLAEFQTSIGLATRADGLRNRESDHRLFTSVVAFGREVMEVQGPTLTGLRAVDAITRLPGDTSGVERTMHAVNRVVNLYRGKRRNERIVIVLLTDESGDDGLELEKTILNCRQNGIAVHVIGPTAVMGLEEGSQLWTAQFNGQPLQFLLKVNRGPETCLPERAFLPYWHESPLSAWRPGVRPANSVPWYGGEYREGVLSGFGPYALTRLALQTGGTYTLYDGGENIRYDQDQLRRYFPEYGSLTEYQASIQDRPLRMFVAEAAAVTLRESDSFAPVQMMFFGSRSTTYPFSPISAYMEPLAFPRKLKDVLILEQRKAERAAQRIDMLLGRMPEPELEYAYAKDESPRWRAWFDLTRGRLLAASVRYREYIATCEMLRKTKFNEQINEVRLVPGKQFRVASSASTAQQAVRLLERCQSENLTTPWSDLATWELQTGFGIEVLTKAIPRPPPAPPSVGLSGSGLMGSGGGGSISFPSL